jgi:hypothetical protein
LSYCAINLGRPTNTRRALHSIGRATMRSRVDIFKLSSMRKFLRWVGEIQN